MTTLVPQIAICTAGDDCNANNITFREVLAPPKPKMVERKQNLLAINLVIPPAAWKVFPTVCSTVLRMPTKESIMALNSPDVASNAAWNTENITSNTEAIRSLMEDIIDDIDTRSGRYVVGLGNKCLVGVKKLKSVLGRSSAVISRSS